MTTFTWNINYRFCACLVVLFFSMLNATVTFDPIHISVNDLKGGYESIDLVLQEPNFLENITFSSDVYLATDEFYYLIGMLPGSYITCAQLKKGVAYLFQKKKFNSIDLLITPGTLGIKIHCTLYAKWTLDKVRIYGLLRFKDAFKKMYIMEPGDAFDTKKHELSVEKIKESCKQEGYFNTSIQSNLSYNHTAKSIMVSLSINRGKIFTIASPMILDIHVESENEECINSDEIINIRYEINKRFFKRLIGTKYSKEHVTKQACDMREFLMQKGYFHTSIELEEMIDYERQEVTVIWHIALHQKRVFMFWGNRALSSEYLLEVLLQFGRSAWLLPACLLAEEITRIYHEKGFWNVQVDTQEESERYYFLISEGNRARIDRVEICNATYRSSAVLVKKFFYDLIQSSFFSEQLFQDSCHALIDWYLKEGFLHAMILQHEYIPSDSPDTYTLKIRVREGQRSMLAHVHVPPFFQEASFPWVHKIHDNVACTMEIVNNQRDQLLQWARSQGYINVQVKPALEINDQGMVILNWDADLGSRVCFGKTIIEGSGTFPFTYIMRELQYEPGQLWDQEKVRRSFLRLKELDIFESISLRPLLAGDKDEEEKPIVLQYVLDDPFEVRVRGGLEFQHIRKYQTFAGITYKAGGALLIKNPTNTADHIRFDVNFTGAHREVVACYKRPWLGYFPVHTHVQAYTNKYDQSGFIGSKKNIYTITQQGILFGVQKKWEYLDSQAHVGIEWMETKINESSRFLADQLSRAINFESRLLEKMIPFFFYEPTVLINYLDNSLDPHKGLFTLCSLKGMFPLVHKYHDSFLIKLLIEQSVFFPIGPLVSAFRFRIGHIFHRSFSEIMPSERFYLGGSHSLRSYETDLAPPLGIFIDREGCRHLVPRGGKTMININAELRMPLFKYLSGVIFQDVGVLSSDFFADVRLDRILAGIGFGLRYLTPIGPLRFDIGWKLHSTHGPLYAWFLTFGHAF